MIHARIAFCVIFADKRYNKEKMGWWREKMKEERYEFSSESCLHLRQ